MTIALSDTQKKKIFIGLAGAIGLLFWFQVFLIPQRKVVATSSPKVRSLQRQLKELREHLVQLPRDEKELARLSSQKGTPSAASPEQQLLEILESVALMARSTQVQLTAMKPKMDLSQLVPGQSGFLELPVEANGLGGYHQIGAFLGMVERSDSFVKLRSLEIRPDSRNLWKHQVVFVLDVYLLPGMEQAKS